MPFPLHPSFSPPHPHRHAEQVTILPLFITATQLELCSIKWCLKNQILYLTRVQNKAVHKLSANGNGYGKTSTALTAQFYFLKRIAGLLSTQELKCSLALKSVSDITEYYLYCLSMISMLSVLNFTSIKTVFLTSSTADSTWDMKVKLVSFLLAHRHQT